MGQRMGQHSFETFRLSHRSHGTESSHPMGQHLSHPIVQPWAVPGTGNRVLLDRDSGTGLKNSDRPWTRTLDRLKKL